MRTPPAIEAAVLSDYAAGIKVLVICAVHGVAERTVLAIVKRAGAPVRARGRPRPAQQRPRAVYDRWYYYNVAKAKRQATQPKGKENAAYENA